MVISGMNNQPMVHRRQVHLLRTFTTSATAVPTSIPMNFAVPAALRNVYDRFMVNRVTAKLACTGTLTSLPLVFGYDNSGTDGVYTTINILIGIQNAIVVEQSTTCPKLLCYTIDKPGSIAVVTDQTTQNDELLRVPIAVEHEWDAGTLMIHPMITGVPAAQYIYSVWMCWDINFIQNRSL